MATSGEETNLWTELLSGVQSRTASAAEDACVLVLGDSNSGKTSLVSRLQCGEQPARAGHGLEFNYIEVNPESAAGGAAAGAQSHPDVGPGEISRLSVFVLGGDAAYSPLVKFVYGRNPKRICRSLAILCASMSEPWSIVSSLEQWAHTLDDCVRMATSGGGDHVLSEGRRNQTLLWQTYVEPPPAQTDADQAQPNGEGGEVVAPATTANSAALKERMQSLDEQTLLPLGEDVLTSNVGIPIVVALTKICTDFYKHPFTQCDMMPNLERECDLRDEHFDFIQMHVRRFCLKYGCALAYTSAKDRRNCDALRAYVLRRTEQPDMADGTPAHVVDRDAIFIPAGWDNTKKIAILHEGLAPEMSPDDRYSLHVKRPPPRNLHRMAGPDSVVQSEEEQAFLARLQPLFAAPTGPNAQTTPAQASIDVGSNGRMRSRSPRKGAGAKGVAPAAAAGATPGAAAQPGAAAAGAVDPAGGSLVQEFFKNLLTTKSGAPAPVSGSGASEAELELLRLAKGSRAPVS